MNLKKQIEHIAKEAKEASRALAKASSDDKNKALKFMAQELIANASTIIKENQKDLAQAKRQGLSSALIDRLALNKKRVEEMAKSINEVIHLEDPCGKIDKMWKRPSGLVIGKMRVPIGVIAIIYESRPNVTADCAALCVKSGNAVILKGGRESLYSNFAIHKALNSALKKANLPQACVSIVSSTDRASVEHLLKMDKYIDLVIPRGGEGLIKMVAQKSRIPVIKHYKGVCHTYVDKDADLKKALDICVNAKVQRPGVCNAMETMLVNRKIADKFLPVVIKKLQGLGVKIRGCKLTQKIAKDVRPAKESDWYEEYLDLILAVRVVNSVDEAIAHITKYGSSHSDAIITEDFNTALKFLKQVDSACVYANASTRFTDGYQFGFGAEIGISTDKIHARGPMALEELTSYKYIVFGDGQIRK